MANDVKYYLSLNYPIELIRDPVQNAFFAFHPDLDGCAAQGETADQAVARLDDARQLWITTRVEDGLPVPEPVTREYSGRVLLRMSSTLHESLAYMAKRREISLNLLLNEVLANYAGGATVFDSLQKVSQFTYGAALHSTLRDSWSRDLGKFFSARISSAAFGASVFHTVCNYSRDWTLCDWSAANTASRQEPAPQAELVQTALRETA
jgi:antitoxin HicB